MPDIRNKKYWILVSVAWAAAIIMIATIFWNLAAGYSWTLPLVGTVPGPPTSLQQTIFTSLIIISLAAGSIASFIILVKGRLLQRVAAAGPGLLFAGVIVYFISQLITF